MEKAVETNDREAWGTWEELLLAFAVKRYGSKSWESVAGEIQKRSSSKSTTSFLTPCNCKQKFHDLKRRYDAVGDDDTIPWLDDLRKLRITELKRQLQHYDLSILSLRSKLKEEEEEGLKVSGNGQDQDKLDPEEEKAIYTVPDKLLPKSVVCELVDPEEPVLNAEGTDRTVSVYEKPVREESCNGSTDSVDKEMVRVEQQGGAIELIKSVAESKGSGEKESSDVQSCANKLKKEEESDRPHSGGSGADCHEIETQDQSPPALKERFLKSQHLLDFLQTMLSHNPTSVFERLFENQKTSTYRNLIRQHIDIKSVRRNVEEGWYIDCEHKFFRDLLLLVNNVMVFFGRKSSECIAAAELRQLISNKMAQRNTKANPSAGRQTLLSRLQSEKVQKPSDSLLVKPQIAGIIPVSRKRSSLSAKGLALSSGSERKRKHSAAILGEDKLVHESKQTSNSSAMEENNNRITNKRSRDGSASSPRSSKKNGKNPANTNYGETVMANNNQEKGTVGSPSEHSESKSEKILVTAELKKRSAANFLDRLRRTSSPNSGPFLDTSLGAEKDEGTPKQKKTNRVKGDEREAKVTKRSSRGSQQNERSSPNKRRLGRPPKGAAAPAPGESKKRTIRDTAAKAPKHLQKRSRK